MNTTPHARAGLTTAQETVQTVVLIIVSFVTAWMLYIAPCDWMFASPIQLGRLPWSYDQIWRVYQKAAKAAGIGGLGTHSLRHSYRSWLDSVGTPVGVQQKLMRHADIRTTMNVYGDAATDEMAQAHSKVVGLALNGAQTERKAS